jgi:Na+/H+ antiporter NhaD/arsenite permease-like protein
MALASLRVVVSGSLAFLVFWLLAVFPSFRPLPLGRTAGAMAGAVLSVALGVLTPTRAYEAVDLSILGLLFGTMVVSLYLQQADLFKYLGHALSWRSYGGRDLLCRTCLLGALSGALFTNDTCCLVLTSFVLKLCHRQGLPPLPFLLGLSTSANIGSAATPIGNPQNLVIAALGGIPFSTFFLGLLPSVLLGVLINTLMLLAFYWNQLSPPADPHLLLLHHLGNGSAPMNDAPSSSPRSLLRATKNATPWTPFQSSEELDIPHRILHPATRKGEQPIASDAASNGAGAGDDDDVVLCVNEPGSPLPPQAAATMDPSLAQTLLPNPKSFVREESPWMKMFAWKFAVYFVACAMLAAFLLGYDLSWTSLTAAVCLMALDFRDAGPNLDKVSIYKNNAFYMQRWHCFIS